jgi:hypothetical protein
LGAELPGEQDGPDGQDQGKARWGHRNGASGFLERPLLSR